MMKVQAVLKSLKAGWVENLLSCPGFIVRRTLLRGGVFFAGLLLLSGPSWAGASESRQQLVYEVYAGGIHAVQATFDMDMRKKGHYGLIFSAKTRGFLASLVPWEGTFESYGWILKGEKFRPEQHKSTTSWRDSIDIKDYHYNKDGTFKTFKVTDEYSQGEAREVDAELVNQTIDTLSAVLQVLQDYNENGQCAGFSEVFDGKRRFKQDFQHQQMVELKASKYNIFSGMAAECTVEVTPLAGAWNKKPRGWLSIQEQGRERKMMPTVWIGKLSKDGPAVPVKVRIKTAYGTLFMHLAEYQNGDEIIVAQKRMK